MTVRIIPCLDVKDGRVVKGINFSNLRDAGDPVELAALYERDGADELVFLDISATPEQRKTVLPLISKVRDVLSIPLTVGGGVRGIEDAKNLLQSGADKVGVNTAAVNHPKLIDEIAASFGAQCAILALDAARTDLISCPSGFEVVTFSGQTRTGIDALSWAKEASARGAGELLLTSFDRDGTGIGYDLELLELISSNVSVPVIASGGAQLVIHLVDAVKSGASALLAASIFHYGQTTIRTLKDELMKHKLNIRPF